jgi:hypothetical protein
LLKALLSTLRQTSSIFEKNPKWLDTIFLVLPTSQLYSGA